MSDSPDKDSIIEAVRSRALEIASLPPHEREEQYELCREVYLQAAQESGVPDPEEMAAKMDEWIRGMVAIIETSGGGRGGSA